MMNESAVAGKRSFRAILAAGIAVLIIIGIFTTTAFAQSAALYEVTIVDNSVEMTVSTAKTEPMEILKSAGISLSAEDKLDITAFEQGVGGTLTISRYNMIHVEFDNQIQTYQVYGVNVGAALAEIGITLLEQDEINYALTEPVRDGMLIKIRSAFSVTLQADGEEAKYAIVEGTVADVLALANITLGAEDYTKPSLETPLKKDMQIKVFRVAYQEETRSERIAYSTKTIKDKNLKENKTKVLVKGVDGQKDVTYRVKYINGKKSGEQKMAETVVSEPVQKEIKVGTKSAEKTNAKPAAKAKSETETPAKNEAKEKETPKENAKKKDKDKKSSASPEVKPNGVTSKNGFSVGQTIQGRYTHYCACATCNGSGSGTTASGKRISNGMKNPYYIACNWLPMGSVIKVNGHCYTVVDRGGSGLSRKGRIDIFTPEGHAACYRKGTGSCKIEIIRLGW